MNIQMTGESVRAIIAGTKTQTRRVIVPQPTQRKDGVWMQRRGRDTWDTNVRCEEVTDRVAGTVKMREYYKPIQEWLLPRSPYKVGDVLWVKERWTTGVTNRGSLSCVIYEADKLALQLLADDNGEGDAVDTGDIVEPYLPDDLKFKAAIFMPAWAARIFLRITDVRVERVQEITRADCVAEGIVPTFNGHPISGLQHEYAALWDSINAKRGYPWASNPWVFVYHFTLAAKQEAAQ